MAHLMRKVAIIGFIAMNSPLLASKPDGAPVAAPGVHQAAQPAPAAIRAGTGGIMAAREAAQILAALDPTTRERVLTATASFAAGAASRR
jgi:hypothetical protein